MAGFPPSLSVKKSICNAVLLLVIVSMTGVARAQTLLDFGANDPAPGPTDISQFSTNGNQSLTGPFNYYTDNASPPGQTFTIGSIPLALTSLAIRTGTSPLNSGGGGLGPQAYLLRIYYVSLAGSKAQLVNTYTSSPSFSYVDGHWLQWSNLSVPLLTNSTYAYTFARASSGYDGLAVTASNYYSGGEAVLISSAGDLTFQSSRKFDAVFDLGLTNSSQLLAGTPVMLPGNTIYIGSSVTLKSPAVGTAPLNYQWQTDGAGGGNPTNIPGATASSVTFTPPVTGNFKYDFIVTNSSGSVTSSVVIVTVLPPASVTVNVANTLAVMPASGLGVCTAVYDNNLISAGVAPQLKAAGIGAVRYPGGSYADIYYWSNNTCLGYVNANDGFDNFMNTVVNPAGAQAIITVNYGSNPANNAGGDTNQAAAWVNYANNVKHWGVKYWEIGNEINGNGYYVNQNWEYDLHFTNQTASARVGQSALSPAAYGSNAVPFITAMKAQDPAIKCGVTFLANYNPYNTPMLQAVGTNADFVIIHWYPGSDTASTLAASTGIAGTVTSTLTELTNILGAAHAAQMKIAITETGAGSANGAPVALYTADNFLTWIENGIINVDYQILHGDLLSNSQTPAHAYYGAVMSHLLAGVGDTFLKTTSAQSKLRVHATTRLDGKTGVMLLNTDPLLAIAATVNITGTNLASSGLRYQFGLTNYNGDTPSFPMTSNTVSGLGNSFTILVPAYTMINLLIPPAPSNTPPVLAAIGNQTVNVGQIVAFTANATDTDQPPQTLTFNLLTGPGSATLNSSNGAFAWRPQVTDANTTNPFAIKVTDNGSPSLSATQTFTVTVNALAQPAMNSIGLSNGLVRFQVSGDAGPDYAVLGSTNLINWNVLLITNSPAMPFSWTDTNSATSPAQYYRIKAGPPLP